MPWNFNFVLNVFILFHFLNRFKNTELRAEEDEKGWKDFRANCMNCFHKKKSLSWPGIIKRRADRPQTRKKYSKEV